METETDMEISIWHKNGNLIAEVKASAVPRVGDHIDIDAEPLLVERVKWIVAAEVMSAEVIVGPANGHAT